MANLGRKNGVYLARFRYEGKEYKRSLKTSDRANAIAALRRVEDPLHWLAIGKACIPTDVDPGDFILSGGTLQSPAPSTNPGTVPSFDEAVREFTDNLGHLAESNRATVRGHLRSLQQKLGAKAADALDRIGPRDLESFLQARLRERLPTTVSKERVTAVQFFDWAVAVHYLQTSPAASLTKVKAAGDLAPFRTH